MELQSVMTQKVVTVKCQMTFNSSDSKTNMIKFGRLKHLFKLTNITCIYHNEHVLKKQLNVEWLIKLHNKYITSYNYF